MNKVGSEHQAKGIARAKAEWYEGLPREPYTLPAGVTASRLSHWITSQPPPSSRHSQPQEPTVALYPLHIRCSCLTNQIPPLPPNHCPPSFLSSYNPLHSWAVSSAIWESHLPSLRPGLCTGCLQGERGLLTFTWEDLTLMLPSK